MALIAIEDFAHRHENLLAHGKPINMHCTCIMEALSAVPEAMTPEMAARWQRANQGLANLGPKVPGIPKPATPATAAQWSGGFPPAMHGGYAACTLHVYFFVPHKWDSWPVSDMSVVVPWVLPHTSWCKEQKQQINHSTNLSSNCASKLDLKGLAFISAMHCNVIVY